MTIRQALIAAAILSASVLSDTALSQGGENASGETIYLFYLHGRIIEDEGPTPTSPRFGLYDYPAIIEALGSQGATVVSDVRESGTEIDQYARKIIQDIETLIAEGVSPGQIIVAGFSKGGGITIQVSRLLGRPEVRFVLMAEKA